MATTGELCYLARDCEPGELNARTPSRTDLFTKKTVSIADGRQLVPAPVDDSLLESAQLRIGMNAVLSWRLIKRLLAWCTAGSTRGGSQRHAAQGPARSLRVDVRNVLHSGAARRVARPDQGNVHRLLSGDGAHAAVPSARGCIRVRLQLREPPVRSPRAHAPRER